MGKGFEYFVKKIPGNIHNKTKSMISEHVAVFIPEEFVIGKKLVVEEYHFVICFSTPPLAAISSKEYQFKRGSLICLAPGDDILVHTPVSSGPAKYMTICVNVEFIQSIYQQTGGQGTLAFRKMDNSYSYQLLEGLEALIHELLYYESPSPLMVAALENRIALQLLRDSHNMPTIPGKSKQDLQENVQQAIKFIETYYSSNITIQDISDAVYISPPYLQKIFLKCVGVTPYQYIMDCRHKKAKTMLETTDIPIETIARQCGFVSNSHFSTTFRLREGIPPLTYRKQLQGEQVSQ